MRYTVKAQTIPDGDPVAGARVTLTRQDDGIVAATGTTDVDGWCTLTANGAPGNVFIEVLRGSDRWRDDSRTMRPYGQFSPAEWAETAQEVCGDGVVPYGTAFALTAGTGSVTIGTGAALLHGVLGVWDTSTILLVSSGARACAVLHSGTGRLQLVDVAQADLTSDHLTLYTYNVSGGTITGVVRVAAPSLEGIMTKHATLQAVVRASTGDTSNASGEASGNEITFDLESGVTYDIEATASVITRERAGAIAIEIDGNLSAYAANGGDVTATIRNSHTRNKTGGSCLIRLFERSDTALTSLTSDLLFGSLGSGDTNFNNPLQVALDSSGNLYVADIGNSRLKKHNSSGAYVTSITGLAGIRGVCVDASDNIYVSYLPSSVGSLRKYNSSLVQQWDVSASPNTLMYLATDGTHVWAADQTSHAIQKRLCSTGALVSTFGSAGSGDGQFNYPTGIALDGTYLYVADESNTRVQKFTTAGAFATKWGTSGAGDGQFMRPWGIAVNPVTGNILVTDTLRDDIQEFTNAGVFVRTFGSYGSGLGQVDNPTGIVVTADGASVYVADQGNDRIQRFTETAASFSYDAAVFFARAIPRS